MKPTIDCEVYVNASYGKVTLAYVPTCSKGKRLLTWYNEKKVERELSKLTFKDAAAREAKRKELMEKQKNCFTDSSLSEALMLVDIRVVKEPNIPRIPRLNEVIRSKVEVPDFLK